MCLYSVTQLPKVSCYWGLLTLWSSWKPTISLGPLTLWCSKGWKWGSNFSLSRCCWFRKRFKWQAQPAMQTAGIRRIKIPKLKQRLHYVQLCHNFLFKSTSGWALDSWAQWGTFWKVEIALWLLFPFQGSMWSTLQSEGRSWLQGTAQDVWEGKVGREELLQNKDGEAAGEPEGEKW